MTKISKILGCTILSMLLSSAVYGAEIARSKTTVAVSGNNLFLLGTFDALTAREVTNKLQKHPEVSRIVFTANGGSEHDKSILQLGRDIRSRGLDTHLISGGVIASGGVSLFLAGNRRSTGTGSFIGVHAWSSCDNEPNGKCRAATDYAKSDSAHDLHRNYTKHMLHSDELYWFSIAAAQPNSIHWLSNKERSFYQLTNYALQEKLALPFQEAFEQEHKLVCHNCPSNPPKIRD